jgi:site-specific recombinase XerD
MEDTQLLDRFEVWMVESQKLADTTAEQYKRRIQQAFRQGYDPADHVSLSVRAFVTAQGGSDSNHDSWAGALIQYQKFCNDVLSRSLMFTEGLKMQKRAKRLPKVADYSDLYRLLMSVETSTLKGQRDRAVLELLYCGLRNDELCRSLLQNFRGREVLVHGKSMPRQGKKERFVPINDEAWFAILRYALMHHGEQTGLPQRNEVADADFGQALADLEERFTLLRHKHAEQPDRVMFMSTWDNGLTPRRVREIIRDATVRAGITTRIYPHMMRHSFATHLLDNGVTDLIALKDVLGHETFEMVQRYVLTSKAGRFSRVNAFHPRQRGVVPAGDIHGVVLPDVVGVDGVKAKAAG